MQDYPIRIWNKSDWPDGLLNTRPFPKKLYIRGEKPNIQYRFLTIIGSRKYSEYGEKVLKFLIQGLKDYPIYIVSGLAFGIDALAHKYAIENNLKTIAFPGSGLDEQVIYPRVNFNLAYEILKSGGNLISEYLPNQTTRTFFFSERNRLMAGISDAILIIEAEIKSGTMITAEFALNFGKDVMCVPGSIFNSNSEGVNFLIKEGATPIYSAKDILKILKIDEYVKTEIRISNLSEIEQNILNSIKIGKSYEKIMSELNIDIKKINQIVSFLELNDLL